MRENLRNRASAEAYHRYTSLQNPWNPLLLARLLQESRAQPRGGTLLDVGTGTAVFLLHLSRLNPFRDVELIGMDYYEDMVEEARRRVAQAGLAARIRIDQADVHHMPYPDGFARYVVSRSTIHHWADPVVGLGELHRVLAPGGVILIHEPRRDAQPEALATFNAMKAAAGVPLAVLEEKYTADEVRGMCEQAGIGPYTTIVVPARGPGAIGFEVRITK